MTERLGLGPDVCLARNPRLVYGRMTGWGQDGPLAHAAGHDINYIALAGALAHFGRVGQPPTPPLNMVGDYGGGGMFLAFGVVCAVLEARASGTGPGGRRGDGRRRRLPHGSDLGPARHGRLQRGARHQPARHRLAVLRRVRDRRRRVGVDRIDRAAVLRAAARAHRRSSTTTCRTRWTAPAGRCCASDSPRASRPRRAPSGSTLLEGTDVCFAPVLPMSEAKRPSAPRRARDHRRARRHRPARAGAALLAHPGRDPGSRRRSRASTPSRARRLGLPRRRGRGAARRRGRHPSELVARLSRRDRASHRVEAASTSSSSSAAVTVTCPSLRPGRGALP